MTTFATRIFEAIENNSTSREISTYLDGCSNKFVGFYKLDNKNYSLFKSKNKNVYRISFDDIVRIESKLSYKDIKIKEVSVEDNEAIGIILEIYKSLNEHIDISFGDYYV